MQQESRQTTAGPNQTLKQNQGKQVTALTSKLNVQAERILKWKLNTEVELRKRDEKLKEFESVIQRQHNNMLNQQLQCEKLSQRLQTELLNRGELKGKIDNTREICTILQTYCTQLTVTLQRCIDEKEVLKGVYDDQMKDIDELSKKFNNLSGQHNTNVQQLKSMVDEERQGRIKNYTDAKALKTAMEQRLEALSKVLKSEKERAELLSGQLATSEHAIKQLSKEKEMYRDQLETVKCGLQEVENTLTSENKRLKDEIEALQSSLAEEKKRGDVLKLEGEEVLSKFQEVVKCKYEALQECKCKENIIDKLTADINSKDGELAKSQVLMKDLCLKKQNLEEQLLEFGQLQGAFSNLQISLQHATTEKDMETQQLNIALEELRQLHQAIQQNEKLTEKYEKERVQSDKQIAHLEKANAELDTKLSEAQACITAMVSEVEQLKADLEAKCTEVANLRSSLDSLAVHSENQLKENQKEAVDLKIINKELENQLQLSHGIIEDQKAKLAAMEQKKDELHTAVTIEKEQVFNFQSALMKQDAQIVELQNDKSVNQEAIAEVNSLLAQAKRDNQQLESRIETLLQEMVKLSAEKNSALSEAACTQRDKLVLENDTTAKLQEVMNSYEKCKEESENRLKDCESKRDSLEQEIEQLKSIAQKLEEKLHLTEKQLNDTLVKMKALADKNESKKQRLLEKVAQLEKRLRVKDSELKDFKGHLSTLSPKVPSIDSQARQPFQTPVTGIPSTPKLKSAEQPTRSILKTPPTTPMTRKRVMFQEESSDTDVSAVDILVIDENEVQRRLEAFKRGDKVSNTPLPVMKSPKMPGIMKYRDSDKIKAPKEVPALKRSRYAGDDPPKPKRLFNKESQAKNKNHQDAFGFDD